MLLSPSIIRLCFLLMVFFVANAQFVLASESNCPKASRLLAKAERLAPSDPKVTNLLDQVTKLCPALASGHYLRGVVYFEQQEYELAKREFSKACKQGKQARYFNGVGQVLLAEKKFNEAKKQFENTISDYPDDVAALEGLAVSQFELQMFEESRQTLQRAVQIDPEKPELYYNLGAVLEQLGELPKAEASYQAAISRRPGYHAASLRLAVILLGRGEVDSADTLIQSLMSVEDKGVELLSTQAAIHEARAEYDEALRFLDLSKDAGDDPVRNSYNRAILMAKQGDTETAQKLFIEVVSQAPDVAAYQAGLGWFYVHTQQWDRALTSLLRATAISSRDSYAFYNLGLVYEQRGEVSEAITAFRRAIELQPEIRYYKQHLERLIDEE